LILGQLNGRNSPSHHLPLASATVPLNLYDWVINYESKWLADQLINEVGQWRTLAADDVGHSYGAPRSRFPRRFHYGEKNLIPGTFRPSQAVDILLKCPEIYAAPPPPNDHRTIGPITKASSKGFQLMVKSSALTILGQNRFPHFITEVTKSEPAFQTLSPASRHDLF
jgi:hypothetical protein